MKPFLCRQCGACCRQPGFVYLTEEDVEGLAAAKCLDVYEFTGQYCLLMDRQHLALKKHPDETCIFLHQDACSVYEARPRQCRDFPLGWQTPRSLEYCRGIKNPKSEHP